MMGTITIAFLQAEETTCYLPKEFKGIGIHNVQALTASPLDKRRPIGSNDLV